VTDLASEDLAEQFPGLAIEFHQLHLLDRKEVIGSRIDLMPGNSTSLENSFRLAACFIAFSRVRLSPHIGA